jgi:hypothetical protein
MPPHRRRLSMALMALLLLCGPAIASPRLVVLLITDDIDHVNGPGAENSIGPGVATNADRMKEFFREVSDATKLPLIQQEIVGAEGPADPWTCANIDNAIKSLEVRPGDTSVVYYAGHGFNMGPTRTAKTIAMIAPEEFRDKPPTEFPFLACNHDFSVGPSPNLDMIASWIAPKRPRLTIVMADACNTDYPGTEPRFSFLLHPLRSTGPGSRPDRRLISLFRDARGTVLMAGSRGNHESWYDKSIHEDPMGFFTRKFLEVIHDMDRARPATWTEVGARLTKIRIELHGKIFEQVPILSVSGPFKTVRSR